MFTTFTGDPAAWLSELVRGREYITLAIQNLTGIIK